jgi:Protein of unknown function (DUF2750)
MPFWSSRSRVEKIIASVPAYADFRPLRLTLDEFQSGWLDDLERDGLLIGINWSGPNAIRLRRGATRRPGLAGGEVARPLPR